MSRSTGRQLLIAWLVALAIGVLGTNVLAAPQGADEARALQDAEQWEDAAEAWGRVTREDPENGTAWFNLGYCLHAAGRLQEAIQVHQRAAGFDEYTGIAMYNLGCAYALVDQPDAAIDALASAQAAGFGLRGRVESDSDLVSLLDDPRLAALIEREAASAAPSRDRSGGQPPWELIAQQAMVAIQEVIEDHMPEIERQAAAIMEQVMGQVNAMLADLHEKLANDPRFTELAMVMQEVMGGGGGGQRGDDWPEATGDHDHDDGWDELDEVETHGASISAGEAQQLLQQGEYDQAIAAFGAIIEQDPDSGEAWFGLAYALHMRGDYKEAIELHRKAASYEQYKGIALYNLACAYALTGKPNKAFDALEASRDAGFDIADAMATDSDLESLRDDPRFKALQH